MANRLLQPNQLQAYYLFNIMVKYLSRSGGKALLVLAAVLCAALASKVPTPTCNSPKIAFNDFPISLQETQSFNMNEYFSGYNLNITIPNRQEFVFIREKVTKLKTQPKNQSGLRNYHFAHNGNAWGNSLVTLSVFGNDTTLRWGTTPTNGTIPDLANEAVVTSDPTVICFDAVWFRAEGIALVDCAQNSTFGLQNYFYYVNTTTKLFISKLKNDMYVPFSNIYHRKIRLLTEDGYHYLIRAYFAEHVDQHFDDNTYIEILSVNNPMKPWTIRVMDRSFLHQDKLSIMDFEVYLGDIYILDYHSGVIKFDISTSQTIIIVGRYRTDSGFTRLGVYSNNMVNEFLLVLAHDHAIIELDWTNQIKPVIITKYSVPEGAWMHDLWVNDQYVVAQITANLTDAANKTVAYQSTYVFTRGSRTYLNAYAAFPHPNFHAFVDMNRDNGQLMTIDTDNIIIYQISIPVVSVFPQNPTLLNKQFSFIVKGESTNEYTMESLVCTFTFKYIVVANDSLALWTTGLKLPDTYYANYPGQLFIPLDRYVLGSNITYGVFDNYDKDPPVSFILQQNTTRIIWWNKQPSIFKYSFLRQEQYDSIDETQLYIYTQDYNNDTHFSRCITVPYTDQVHCIDAGYAPHISFRIANLTANRFHYYNGQYIHLAAILYEALPNEVFIYDVERKAELGAKPITFPAGYEGKIQSIEFVGQYLVVVLRYVKEIAFFDMVECWDHQDRECRELYRIDSMTMTKIGVNYFSPIEVYTSDFHPGVLFVQCIDRVVILDITKTGPIRLAEIKSPATQEPGFYKWKMAIARGELILVNPPNRIQEHDLDEIYTLGDAPMNKVFPTFGYVIPDKFDLDFSDNGNLVYIQAIDPKLPKETNTIIMVYRTRLPAVSSLYDVFHLNMKYDDILIDATGSFGDYVTVCYGSILMMFRQYETPILVFEDSFSDYSFNLTYTNDPQARFNYLSKSSVKIANYPEDIYVNDTRLNQTDFLTSQFDYSNNFTQETVFDDSTWLNGSVLNYTLLNCDECNSKMKVVNHVNEERLLLGVHDMEDYAFSFDGGFIQQFQSIIKMRHNGSIEQFVSLPSVLDGENCISIEHHWVYDFSLSACKNSNEVYLYTTVYTASKPFVNGPYYSTAQHVTSMHVMEELMIVVDVDENPWAFDREGGVLIYAMNHDPFEPEIFDEIEYINTDDLTAANDWVGGPCFIANAHFSFTNISGTYRLVITELRNGLFVVDFRWTRGRKSVEILKVEFINLKEELVRIHMPLPNAAFFTAVAINKEYYDAKFGYWQTEVIVVTSNFHSFQVNLHIDKTGTIATHQIAKIFYRYGFYESENYIKTFDGYFAIGQRLPVMLEIFDWYSKAVLTVYDTYEHWTFNEETGEKEMVPQETYADTNIPVEYILGGYTFPKGRITFDWNFTFTRNASDPFRRIGLLALHNRENRIRELSVHEKLIIRTEEGISNSQNAVLRARNDYHKLDIPFKLLVAASADSLPGWAIALIVIGSVAVAGVIGYVLFIKFVKGKRPNRESEITEKSLLEHEGEAENENKDSDSDEEDQEDEQEEGQEEEQEEEEGYQPPKVEGSTEHEATVTASLNRETITSVDEAEARPVEEEKKEE